MIPDDKALEEAHRKEFGNRDDASDKEHWDYTLGGFRSGANWMKTKILEGARDGFDQWFGSRGFHLHYEYKNLWQAATIAAEARHREALKAKDAEMGAAKRNNIKLFEEFKVLESRIEKLRDALEFIKSGCLVPPDGGSPDLMDAVNSAKEALANDDKAKEMSK